MKNLFKKTQSHSSDSGKSSSLVTPKKYTLKPCKSPSTPPITPSPTKSEDAVAGLSVKIIPSQKEHTSRPQESIKSETNDIYDFSKDSDESTLFASVLGLGCGSPLWEVSSSSNNDMSSPRHIWGSQLTPIPEENLASLSESRKHEWGIAPDASFDDEETEGSAENHDDFEVVLQQASHPNVLLCQPCEEESTGDKLAGTAPQQTSKRRFKFPKVKSNNKNKRKVDTKESTFTTEGSSVSSKGTSINATFAQGAKSAVHKDRRKVLIGKIFHARFHKNQRRNDGPNAVSTSTTVKASDKVISSNETVSKKKSQSKRGKWKCAHDPSSKRFYYYHTVTREVTWERPPGFIEWKVARDINKRHYFYNVITKETTWDMPSNFQLWREVKDKNSGKNYYYNVLTKETSWEKPVEPECEKVARDDDDQNVIQVLVTDNSEQPEESLDKGAAGTTRIEEVSAAVSKMTVQDDRQEASNHNDMDLKSSVSTEATSTEDPPRIFKTDNHIRLERLLSTYCPDEKENNAQLLDKCKGQETPIIKALEGIVEDTPFDELRLTIFSFVKTILREMGELPFDERKPTYKSQPRTTAHSQFLVSRPSPKRISRVNTYASSVAGYSLGSRALSHVTGRSATTNMTEQTNRINNTSSRVLNSKQAQILQGVNENYPTVSSVENSFEDLTDVTDDDVQKNVVLDMKDIQNQLELPESTLVKSRSEQTGEHQKITSLNTGNTCANVNNDSMTIESAYAADNDDETDHNGWEEEDEDDVSALSDSFVHSTTNNEKKILSSREEYLKNKKISSKSRVGVEKGKGENHAVMFVGTGIAQVEKESLYTSLKPHPRGSNRSTSSAELSSVGYEELPRLHARNSRKKDSDSLSSWDTITTGSE